MFKAGLWTRPIRQRNWATSKGNTEPKTKLSSTKKKTRIPPSSTHGYCCLPHCPKRRTPLGLQSTAAATIPAAISKTPTSSLLLQIPFSCPRLKYNFASLLMDKRHYFMIHVMTVVIIYFSCNHDCNGDRIDSSSEKAKTCNANLMESSTFVAGCLPCNQEYISASYFNNHDKLVDSEFHDFLPKSVESTDLCQETMNHVKMLKLSGLKRDLIGEGSHRNLVSTIILNMQSDDSVWFHEYICNTILIERLPIGVFADPFELQHLVDRKIYISADVFGDTNLELPSALSNRTVVEIHMDIGSINGMKSRNSVTQLPLHARYPPLDSSNEYARVEIGNPDLLVRCRPKYLQDKSCFWAVSNLHSDTNSVVWQIPCGNEQYASIAIDLIQQTCPNTFGAQVSSTTEDFHLRFESFQFDEFYSKCSNWY